MPFQGLRQILLIRLLVPLWLDQCVGAEAIAKLDHFPPLTLIGMRLVSSVLACILAMLISFRPLTLSTAIKSVRSRTLGIATSIHAELRTFSDHPAGELLGSAPDFSRCTRSDVDTYRLIRICDDQEKLEYTFGLLMNIVRQPYLGHLVKKIEYIHRANNARGYPELPYQRKLAVDDMQLLKRAVGNAGFQDKRLQRVMGMLMQNDLDQDLGYTTSEDRRVRYEKLGLLSDRAVCRLLTSAE